VFNDLPNRSSIAQARPGLLLLLSLFFLLPSCVTYKQLAYLQEASSEGGGAYPLPPASSHKIKSGDYLHIRVTGWEEKTYAFFNLLEESAAFSPEYFYYNGYLVDENGEVMMPVLGKMALAGLSIPEARQKVQTEVDQFLKESYVSLKLANARVMVMGEVGAPGPVNLLNEKTSLFEVLALSGDISPTGNRQAVKLIRTLNDTAYTYSLDLTDPAILSSESLYVLPGDVIYVEPMKARILSSNIAQIGGTLGLIISVVTLIRVLSL
jgi:polysaccharide export outer membrane protein